jgi:hypothetical protein
VANVTVMSNFGFREHPVLRPSIGIPLIILSSLALYVFPIHNEVATIVFLVIGPIAMVFMWTKDTQFSSKPERSMTMAARIWATLFLISCVWELGSYTFSTWAHNDNAYPTVSILLGPLLKTSSGKGVFLLIWIGIGMQLLRFWRKK